MGKFNLWIYWEAYKMRNPEMRQVLEWQEQDYNLFAATRKMAVKKKGKTKMAVYRSKHTGKIYTVAEWPDTHLGIIMVKDHKAKPAHRDYSIGPFGSVKIAERLLKKRAEWLGW